MKWLGQGGSPLQLQVPEEEIQVCQGTKEDIALANLCRAFRDYPILVGNVQPKQLVNKHLAKMVDILASVVANPYPTEPEVIPRFLGFSIYTASEPRQVEEWGMLDEVDRMISREVKVLYPDLVLKAYPSAEERRRMALIGRGRQELLTQLAFEIQSKFLPSRFAECLAFVSDSTEYFLLVELNEEELTAVGFSDCSYWQRFVKHLEQEWQRFSNASLHKADANKELQRRIK